MKPAFSKYKNQLQQLVPLVWHTIYLTTAAKPKYNDMTSTLFSAASPQ